MDPIEQAERRQEAQRRLRAQRRRAGRLRSRAVAISLVAFVLLWGIVFAQMVAGDDPVLGAGPKAAAPRIAPEVIETSAPEEEGTEAVEPEPLEEVEEEAVEPEPEPAPVTTSQS